jgi:ATP-dependent Clp protease protease subunit
MGREARTVKKTSSYYEDHPVSQQLSERVIPERIIYLTGEVNEHSIAQVIAGIVILANQDAHAPITLLVSTYGGSVDEMFSLYDVIKHVSCPIHTVGLGKIMSAGVLILACGKKGHRTIGKSARVMIHSVSAGCDGTIFKMKNELKEVERQQELMEEMLLKETKITRTKLNQIMKNGVDYYLTAQEALKLGIVDTIIEPKENK